MKYLIISYCNIIIGIIHSTYLLAYMILFDLFGVMHVYWSTVLYTVPCSRRNQRCFHDVTANTHVVFFCVSRGRNLSYAPACSCHLVADVVKVPDSAGLLPNEKQGAMEACVIPLASPLVASKTAAVTAALRRARAFPGASGSSHPLALVSLLCSQGALLRSTRLVPSTQPVHPNGNLNGTLRIPATIRANCTRRSLFVRASGTNMVQTALEEMKDGAFVRTASACRNQITADGSSGFPAVANRYVCALEAA